MLATKLEVEVDHPLEMNEQTILVDGKPVAVRCSYVIESFINERVSANTPSGYTPTDLSTTLQQMFGDIAAEGTIENYFEAMPCEPRTSERLGVRGGHTNP